MKPIKDTFLVEVKKNWPEKCIKSAYKFFFPQNLTQSSYVLLKKVKMPKLRTLIS